MLVMGLIKDPPEIYRTWILLVISDLLFVSCDVKMFLYVVTI